jgi:hypothetical protein
VVRVPGYRSRDPGFDSRRYHIFWEVVGLERGTLSLMSITEELLEWKRSGSESIKPRLTAVRIRCADHATPSISKKVALTSPTSGGRWVGIVSLRSKASEFSLIPVIRCTLQQNYGSQYFPASWVKRDILTFLQNPWLRRSQYMQQENNNPCLWNHNKRTSSRVMWFLQKMT